MTEFISRSTDRIGKAEFELVSTLNCHLIVHQPYRVLEQVGQHIGLTPSEFQCAETVISDTYRTDVCLLHSPTDIALSCVLYAIKICADNTLYIQQRRQLLYEQQEYLSSLPHSTTPPPIPTENELRNDRLRQITDIFQHHGHDMNSVITCTQEIITMYALYSNNRAIEDMAVSLIREVLRELKMGGKHVQRRNRTSNLT